MVSKKTVIIIVILTILYLYVYVYKTRMTHRMNFFYSKSYRDKIKNLTPEPGFQVIEYFNIDPSITKIFTTSLYGNNPKYFKGLNILVKDIEKRFPDWRLRLYLHDKVNLKVREKLKNNKKIQLAIVKDRMVKPGNSAGAFWRFLPLCEDVTFICLDTDDGKVAIPKEKIKEWLNDNNSLYYSYISAYNFPWPRDHIDAGKWGRKSGGRVFDRDLVMSYPHRSTFGSDEIFLYEHVVPDFKKYGCRQGSRNLWSVVTDVFLRFLPS